MRESVVKRIPEIPNTPGLRAGHAETVDVSGEVSAGMLDSSGCVWGLDQGGKDLNDSPLRGRAAVVGQTGLRDGGVCLIIVEVRGQDISWAVEFRARRFVIAGQNHVRDLDGQIVDPLLPQIPVALVQHAHIASLGATLVGNLACWQRNLVLVGHRGRAGQLGGCAIIADGPAILAGQDAGVPVVSVRDIASVPDKSNVVGGSEKLLVRSLCVGVAHVVDNRHLEGVFVTGGFQSSKTKNARGSGAVCRLDAVVVSRIVLEVINLDVVEELTALRHDNIRARRSTIVSVYHVSADGYVRASARW